MNVDEMEAGRELDALIARRVMGWVWVGGTEDGEPYSILYPTEVAKQWVQKFADTSSIVPEPISPDVSLDMVPRYSEKFPATVEVVDEYIRRFNPPGPDGFALLYGTEDGEDADKGLWTCILYVPLVRGGSVRSRASTKELAVCRASLKAAQSTGNDPRWRRAKR